MQPRVWQLDARIRACVSLDGSLPPAVAFPEFPDKKGFSQPVLLLEVDHTECPFRWRSTTSS
ncbi:hypothetical protein [Acidisarcina polymorpha]|nr:hypothetical protein [Acidisarcina polymorpha]